SLRGRLAEGASRSPASDARCGGSQRVAAFGAAPEVSLTVEGVGITVVHDAGPRAGRDRRLARRFPDADVIVFGHSHVPMLTRSGGQRFLNPASSTWKRPQPRATYATVTVNERRMRIRIVEMFRPASVHGIRQLRSRAAPSATASSNRAPRA